MKNSNKINESSICRLYNLRAEQLKHIVFFDQALGFKVTLRRKLEKIPDDIHTSVYWTQLPLQHMSMLIVTDCAKNLDVPS